MKAITREEKIISGENLTPITRKEMFLAKAAGMDIETPEPITREEMFLSKISGSGGGSAVLTELVVTENGVYDKPMIGGGAVEIAVGKTVTFKKNLPDAPFQNSGGKSLTFYREHEGWTWMMMTAGGSYMISGFSDEPYEYVYVTESVASAGGDPMYGITTAGWHKVDFTAGDMTISRCDPPSITIQNGKPMSGTTNIEMLTLLADLLFEAPSTPADGWNKVTVNVAGDIIDVDELPTENIEEGKIYRVTNGDIVTYGIPNAHPVKRFVDGAWVELA